MNDENLVAAEIREILMGDRNNQLCFWSCRKQITNPQVQGPGNEEEVPPWNQDNAMH